MDIEGAPAEAAGTEPPATNESRRSLAKRLLGLGVGGAAAVALVPQIAGRAGASTPSTGDSTTTTAPAASTTSAPKQPTPADVELLDFVQSVEIAAYELYRTALKGTLPDTEHIVLDVISQGHLAYAQSLSGMLGRDASNAVNEDVVSELTAAFSGPLDGVLQAAYDLESALVATQELTISQLVGTNAVYLLASIATVEGRNGTVLADLMGSTDLSVLLVDNEADALAPAKG